MTKLPDCDHLCNSSSLQEKQPEERILAIFVFVVLFVVVFVVVFVFVYTDSGTKNSVPRQNKS